MSATSVHRLKDRGGGKFPTSTKPIKPLTPSLSEKSLVSQNAPGKENPQRPASRPRASSVTRPKPIMPSMPRINKEVGVNEARARFSTSSFVSRGRSSSPSEFTRVLADMRKGVNKVVEKRVMNDKLIVERKISDKGKLGLEKSGKNGRFLDDLKLGENKKVGCRDGRSVCEDEKRVSEKLDKNGIFVDDLKLGEDKKFRSRVGRNVNGNSCSSSVEMQLNGRIDVVEKISEKGKWVLEKPDKNGIFVDDLKLVENKKYNSGAGSNLISLGESRVNGDVDSEDKKWVYDSTELKSGNEFTQSDTFAETEMKFSGNNVESYGSKELNGKINVDLSIKDHVLEEVKVRASSAKSDKMTCKGSRLVGRSSVSSGGLKEKAPIEEGKSSTLSAKRYSSKLHEKLAFLEGKVKKIASDIKQTKEMLDLNNPDASKVKLTDIQEKISGIEKAMGNVVGVSNANIGQLKDDGNADGKLKESIEHKGQVRDGKRSVKGLNVHDLEARLFPHHKLLKDRTCLKPTSEISQVDESREEESTRNQKSQERSKTPIDEIPIALEFLESLEHEQSSIPVEDTIGNTENSEDAATENHSTSLMASQNNADFLLSVNEKVEEFDEQENTSRMVVEEENENTCAYMLKEIGHKISTGGWFVSEGEAVLLAHDDGSCSYYDITNSEEKAVYNPPVGISPNLWRDCWIVRAPSADGCSGRYVVAASAGNSFEAGFCAWEFYSKDVTAFRLEDGTANVRTALADLPNNTMHRRNVFSSTTSPEHQQWFYRPCGPLIVSTASCQRSVKVYDIRDGEHVMRWDLQKPVATMEYSSPLQWKNRGKLVLAEAETISLWDVSSLSPQPLLSVSSCNRKISALHVNNTDAELGGGVRQRVSSSEAEGNDGVFCTADSINVLDFRQPSGIGLKIPKVGVDVQSVFSQGDSILLGCTSLKSAGKKQFSSQIQQFSLRGQKLLSTYVMPESNAHSHHKAITQVWGNSNLVMGVCGLGLCVYDSSKDEGLLPYSMDCAQTNNVKEVIGPDDLYYPSFDYLGSRVLLISRDRPALWRYVS